MIRDGSCPDNYMEMHRNANTSLCSAHIVVSLRDI